MKTEKKKNKRERENNESNQNEADIQSRMTCVHPFANAQEE